MYFLIYFSGCVVKETLNQGLLFLSLQKTQPFVAKLSFVLWYLVMGIICFFNFDTTCIPIIFSYSRHYSILLSQLIVPANLVTLYFCLFTRLCRDHLRLQNLSCGVLKSFELFFLKFPHTSSHLSRGTSVTCRIVVYITFRISAYIYLPN